MEYIILERVRGKVVEYSTNDIEIGMKESNKRCRPKTKKGLGHDFLASGPKKYFGVDYIKEIYTF